MSLPSVLAALRSGDAPDPDMLRAVAQTMGTEAVAEAQLGALAMGICRTPLSPEGRVALTEGMRDSGECLSWDLPGPVLDKHSTGGVGDCVSLALAPALAACGAYVPMISGRGLGHTGGTLDKLASIPGVSVDLTQDQLHSVTAKAGCAITGATAQIAPADRRLYAVRDVTETVQSLDLITASILSKKLAAGTDALVLDVKVGSGAFMKTLPEAQTLARALSETANGAGCSTAALITDMSQPLVTAAGNALEIVEVMETLTCTYVTGPLWVLVERLGGLALSLGGLADTPEAGASQIRATLQNGRAAERFGQMIAAQGGPSDFVDRWRDRLPAAPVMIDVAPDTPGHVGAVDTQALGEIVVDLGGGRRLPTDRIDPTVGLSHLAGIGEDIGPSRPLARIHAADRTTAEAMIPRLRAAFTHGPGPSDPPTLVKEVIR